MPHFTEVEKICFRNDLACQVAILAVQQPELFADPKTFASSTGLMQHVSELIDKMLDELEQKQWPTEIPG